MRTLLIIPAFNEAACIAGVIIAVRQHFAGDIVVIDDGSEDDTGALARDAGAVVLRHTCNLGIGAAVQTGFLYALQEGYDFVVRNDGDGQHDPAQIPRLLEPLQRDEADIVVGSRFLAREGYQSTFVRRVGIFILGIVSALVGTRITDPTSGYWAVNRRALAGAGALASRRLPGDRGAGARLARRLPGARAAGHHVRAHRRPFVDQRHVLGLLHAEGRAGAAGRPAAAAIGRGRGSSRVSSDAPKP